MTGYNIDAKPRSRTEHIVRATLHNCWNHMSWDDPYGIQGVGATALAAQLDFSTALDGDTVLFRAIPNTLGVSI